MKKKRILQIILILVVVLLVILAVLYVQGKPPFQKAAPSGVSGVEVTFYDVGQGDSILIRMSDDRVMLIDAGDGEHEETLVARMKKDGVTKIDWLIGTHPDSDHIGGMDSVIKSFQVGQFMIPDVEKDTKTYRDMIKAAEGKCPPVNPYMNQKILDTEDLDITVVAPEEIVPDESNDNSIVIRLDYGKTSFLFTGDAPYEPDYFPAEQITVLKVAHHGSRHNTTQEALERIDPEYTVISVGEGNKYGHPHEEVMNLLAETDAEHYRTDEHGSVRMTSDGQQIKVTLPDQPHLIMTVSPTGKVTATPVPQEKGYIGNRGSKTYHTKDCSGLPAEQNQVAFTGKKEAEDAGYKPCSRCKP